MDDATTAFLTAIGKFGLLPAAVIYAASFFFKNYFATRATVADTSARADIIDTLNSRVATLEASLITAQNSFDAERTLRRGAEDTVATLTRQLLAAGVTPAVLTVQAPKGP